MNQEPSRLWFRAERLATVAFGAAIPLMVAGRGYLQAAAGLALVIVLAWLLRPRQATPWSSLAASAQARWILAIMLAWLPGVLFSFKHSASASTWLREGVMIGGCAVVGWWLAHHAEHRRLALKALLAVGAAGTLAASAWLMFEGALFTVGNVERLQSVHNTYKAASSALVCLLPVSLWAGHRLGGRWRWLGVAMLVGCLGVIWGSHSRSAIAGIGGGALLALLAATPTRWRVPATLAALVAVPLALVAVMHAIGSSSGNVSVQTTLPLWLVDAHRQAIWGFVWDRFLESPLIGHGLNVVNLLPGAGDPVPGIGMEYVPSHPHNWVVEMLAETGLVGTLPVIAWIGWTVLRCLRGCHPNAVATAGLLGCFWGAALFNHSIWAVWWQLSLLLLYALLAAAGDDGKALP